MQVVKQRKKPVQREAPVHRSILHFCEWKLPSRAIVHHSPNELDMAGTAAAIQVVKARSMGTKAGWPDLEILLDGVTYFLEVKPPKVPVPKDQREFHDKMRAAGAKLAVVRCIEDVEAALAEWGLIPVRRA